MAEPIKIAMLADKFQTRGTSAYTLRLAEKFCKEEVVSRIYCTDASLLPAEKFKQLSIREYRHQNIPIWGQIVRKFMHRRIAAFQPDLIHIQSPQLLKTGMMLARKLKCPYLVTVHDLASLKKRFPFDVNRGKRIICVSDAVRKDLIANYSFDRKLISVIHSGVEIPESTQTLSVLDQNHTPVIGTAGPLEEIKGIPFFLEAAKILLDKNINAEFVVAGTGPDEVKLRRLAQQLKINNHVTFVPKFYDLTTTLMALDIFCLPSLSQGLGTIMLEAMSRGKPVIASGVGGVFSVLKDKESGLIVPPSDSQALAEGMEYFLNDPMNARTIGKTARRLVETDFGIDKMLSETLQIYQEIIQINKEAKKKEASK